MDYEREPGSDLDQAFTEPDQSAPADEPLAAKDDAASATQQPPGEDASSPQQPAAQATDMRPGMNSWSGEAPGFEAPTRDFGSDADVMDDSFAAPAAPPEWPAVDLTPDAVGADDAATAGIAAAYAAANDEPLDMDDDSDAPIQLDEPGMAQDVAGPTGSHVSGETLNLSQGGVQSIEATTVTLSQGGAGQVRADEMTVEQGGVGLARVGSLKLGAGASAFAVLADEATVEEGSNTFLVVSRSFSGDVRPTIDWRAALAFGAAFGLVLSILRRHR